jgi:hypothetical protein
MIERNWSRLFWRTASNNNSCLVSDCDCNDAIVAAPVNNQPAAKANLKRLDRKTGLSHLNVNATHSYQQLKAL